MKIPEQRQVAQISNHGQIRVATEPMPTPGAGEILVQAACSLVSPGTELQFLRSPELDAPEEWNTFGYQNAGIVVSTGAGCDDVQPGVRVACMGTRYAEHSEFTVVPQNMVVSLSQSVSFEEGAFSNLAAAALHALRRAQPE